jgi:hypothetical protein
LGDGQLDRKIAEQLMDLALALDAPLNQATALSYQIDDIEEQKAVRRVIGETTGRLYTDLMGPIIRQYPDLDPARKD